MLRGASHGYNAARIHDVAVDTANSKSWGVHRAMGWYKKNIARETHPAEEKQPTAFGLYDMAVP